MRDAAYGDCRAPRIGCFGTCLSSLALFQARAPSCSQDMRCPAMTTKFVMHKSVMFSDRSFGRSRINSERHRATDFGAGQLGGVSQTGFSHPTGTIEAPCVVATVCRGVDAEFRPLKFISPIYVWCIGEHVLLWMPPKPHLVYQVGKFFHTSHRMFHCVGQLVAAGEGVPYFDDKGIRFTGTSLPSDFQ